MSKAGLDAEVGAPKRPPRPSRARWYILLGLLVPFTHRSWKLGNHATTSFATVPPRSVNWKSRPPYRFVSLSWFRPSRSV